MQVMRNNNEDLFVEEKKIKHVAMYARKSRGDGVEDLEKHITSMKALCEAYGWTYELFTEIKSGSTIVDRPEMVKVLDLIEHTKKFDALLAFDQDRLSRGASQDQQQIMYILKKTNTMMILANPYQLLNPNDEATEETMLFRGFAAQLELKQTKKRFITGKKIGAQMGNWVFGQHPYGYDYSRKTKRLVINEEQSKIVERIKTEFMEGKSITDITWDLNKDNIPSKSGGKWNPQVVRALLKNEVYTGCSIYNKTQGTPESRSKNRFSITNPYKSNPKSEWKYVYNTHPALITEEEHKVIVNKIESRQQKRRSDYRQTFALSGLVKTPDGYTYSVRRNKNFNSLVVEDKKYRETPCYIVDDAILTSLTIMKNKLALNMEDKNVQDEIDMYEKEIKELNTKTNKASNAIEKAKEGFLEDIFSADEMKTIQYKKGIEIAEYQDKIEKLRERLDSISNSDNLERIDRIENLIKQLEKNDFSEEEKNTIYKDIISSVTLVRDKNDRVETIVNFL